eukprot:tig00000741_g3825.t1
MAGFVVGLPAAAVGQQRSPVTIRVASSSRAVLRQTSFLPAIEKRAGVFQLSQEAVSVVAAPKKTDDAVACRSELDQHHSPSASGTTGKNLKIRSGALTGTPGAKDWAKRSAARAMLRAVEFTDEDFNKPIVTVANPYTTATPCNSHLEKIGQMIKDIVKEKGGMPFIFGTPVISDGETMGMEGMRYSLVSRDLIADCIEMMHEGYTADGLITLGGCDKRCGYQRCLPCGIYFGAPFIPWGSAFRARDP